MPRNNKPKRKPQGAKRFDRHVSHKFDSRRTITIKDQSHGND